MKTRLFGRYTCNAPANLYPLSGMCLTKAVPTAALAHVSNFSPRNPRPPTLNPTPYPPDTFFRMVLNKVFTTAAVANLSLIAAATAAVAAVELR